MSKSARDTLSGQVDLFGALGETMPDLELTPAQIKATDRERLLWERELLGLYVSAHPLDKFERYLKEQTHDISQLISEHDGRDITVGGTISQLRELLTKKGDKMAFMTVEDKVTSIEVIVFPRIFEEYREILELDKIVIIKGRVNSKDRDGNLAEPKIIVNEIVELAEETVKNYEPTWRNKRHLKINKEYLPEAMRQKPKKNKKTMVKSLDTTTSSLTSSTTLYLKINDDYKTSELEQIRQYCQENNGSHQVILVIGEENRSAVRLPFRVNGSDDLVDSLKRLLGDSSVVLKTKS